MLIATLAALVSLQAGESAPRFEIEGEVRARYESLSGQFRAGRDGSDQLLALRTLVHGRATFDGLSLGMELQDSRTYLDDAGTPLSSSYVNALDILQAYAEVDVPSPFEAGNASVTLGRQTVSIGSKRQIERVSYANVIKAYTGFHYAAASETRALHVIAVVPIDRRPGDQASVGDNEIVADAEQWNRLIWGAHYRHQLDELWLEGFVYGLNESDSDTFPTPNRRYVTPGIRVFRAPSVGEWDLDVEAALRFGSRRASSAATDTTDLDVAAGMLLAKLGYTFDTPWRLRVGAEYYYASGDEDPNDGRFDQYERLFGGRRTDLNNTSLHGPLTPANLSVPGVRFSGEPTANTDFWLKLSAPSLASATDSWVIAQRRDPSGQSGQFLGTMIDGRLRWRPGPDGLEFEFGASALFMDGFARDVPDAPSDGTTLFGYAQIAYGF
ncbi:alginate export family protein [Maricaulaceae bacterium NA33B04]|nr:alginate export family protein [Maricaulaceae bacterium NA33B04]